MAESPKYRNIFPSLSTVSHGTPEAVLTFSGV
jgi:hypothetical protein